MGLVGVVLIERKSNRTAHQTHGDSQQDIGSANNFCKFVTFMVTLVRMWRTISGISEVCLPKSTAICNIRFIRSSLMLAQLPHPNKCPAQMLENSVGSGHVCEPRVCIIGYMSFSLISHSHVYELTFIRRGGGGGGICLLDCASTFTFCYGDKKTNKQKNRYYCREFGPPPAVFIETKHVFFFPKQGLFLTLT